MSLQFRLARRDDAPGLSRFVKILVGIDLPVDYWRWKFFDNPFGPSGLAIALENHEIVGRAGSFAIPFVVEGREVTAHCLCDTDVFEAHRSKAALLGLVNALSGAPGPHGYEGLEFATSTPLAAEFAQTFFGFAGMGLSDSFTRLINPLAFMSRKLKIRLPLFMHKVVKGVWAVAQGREHSCDEYTHLRGVDIRRALPMVDAAMPAVGVLKDLRYLEWRYGQYPQSSYLAFFDDHSPGKGLAVVDLIRSVGVTYGVIHDILCRETGGAAWQNLLRFSIAQLTQLGADAVVMRGILPPTVRNCLGPLRFIRRNSKFMLIVRANGGAAMIGALGDREKWSLSLGDLVTPL